MAGVPDRLDETRAAIASLAKSARDRDLADAVRAYDVLQEVCAEVARQARPAGRSAKGGTRPAATAVDQAARFYYTLD